MKKQAHGIRLASCVIAALAAAAAPAFTAPDDHIVLQQARTYMGNTMPPMTQEIWVGGQAVWMSSGRTAVLTRFDLGKRIYLNPAQLEDDIKGVGVFLASDAAAFVTGATLVVDGGTLAAGGARYPGPDAERVPVSGRIEDR